MPLTSPETMTIYRKGVPETFSTTLTTAEAIELIRKHEGDFPRSLVADYDQWKKVVSEHKLAWVHYLGMEEKRRGEYNKNESKFFVPGARKLFDTAKQSGLKLPSIYLDMNGREVKLKLAPMTGKNPNCVYVTVEGEYRGKIDPSGTFNAFGRVEVELIDLLNALSNDPIGTAKQYGKITNRCCFCRLELTNLNSVYNGYGPVCADKFGLPHDPPPAGWKQSELIEGK